MSVKEASETTQERLTEVHQKDDDSVLHTHLQLQCSEDQPPPRDRLSTLPPELLTMIFDLVYEASDSQMQGGICRNLLPFTTRNLYKSVSVNTLSRLKRLARTIVSPTRDQTGTSRGVEYLGSLIESLTVDIEPELYNGEKEDWENFDCVGLLAALPQLTGLDLVYCASLMKALLSENVARLCFKNIRHIHLTIIGESAYTNLFDIARFDNLRYCLKLKRLDLTFEDHERYDAVKLPVQTLTQTVSELGVQTLHIKSDFNCTSDAELATFLGCFRHLRHLHIQDTIGCLYWDDVLSEVPSELDSLTIRYDHVNDPGRLSATLSRFFNLRSLSVGYCTYDQTTLVALRHHPQLERLSFSGYEEDERADLSYESLNKFIENEVRPPHLREIDISFFDAGTIGQDMKDSDVVPRPLYVDAHGWYLPRWHENFSSQDAVSLVEQATAVGVRITGTIIEAIEVQSKWNEQVAKVNRRLQAEQERLKPAEMEGAKGAD